MHHTAKKVTIGVRVKRKRCQPQQQVQVPTQGRNIQKLRRENDDLHLKKKLTANLQEE